MAKFDIPKFRYLFQDRDGSVWVVTDKPISDDFWEWSGGVNYKFVITGNTNENWRDTLIDLETDDYDFEDGILRRIEK